MTADGVAEHLFDVANQLNRGAALLIDRDEKVLVAKITSRLLCLRKYSHQDFQYLAA
jgi:hypothetical protein